MAAWAANRSCAQQTRLQQLLQDLLRKLDDHVHALEDHVKKGAQSVRVLHLGSEGHADHAAQLVHAGLQLFERLHVLVEVQLLRHGVCDRCAAPAVEPTQGSSVSKHSSNVIFWKIDITAPQHWCLYNTEWNPCCNCARDSS